MSAPSERDLENATAEELAAVEASALVHELDEVLALHFGGAGDVDIDMESVLEVVVSWAGITAGQLGYDGDKLRDLAQDFAEAVQQGTIARAQGATGTITDAWNPTR